VKIAVFGADADGERRDDDGRESWRTAQRTPPVGDVATEVVDPHNVLRL